MKLALGIPGIGDVPAAFAHDLARLATHIVATQDVELMLVASTDAPSNEQREAIISAARESGADLILFPSPDARIPADALDDIFAKLRAHEISLPKALIKVAH